VIGLAAGTLLLPLVFIHDAQFEHGQSLCPLKALTGFPCPGCGITKSLVSLYKGDLAGSIHYHILGIPLALFCVAVIVVALVELSNGRRYFRMLLYSKRLAWSLGIGLGVYHIARSVEFVHSHDVDGILRESIWR
jgi:Protein of unknown function (DUF2752)